VADTKISALGAAAALTGVEPSPVVQAGATVAATATQYSDFAQSKIAAAGGLSAAIAANVLTLSGAAIPNGPHPGFKTGGTRYYGGAPYGSAAGNFAVTANTVYYTPLFLPYAASIDRVLLRTGTTNATGSNALLGIYANLSTGEPGGKLVTINAATVAVTSSSSTNVVVTPDTSPMVLAKGFYWVASVYDAASQMITCSGTEQLANWMFGTTNVAAVFAGTSLVRGYTEASASLPPTATPVAATSGAVPIIGIRLT
jgi:hypothetical protein